MNLPRADSLPELRAALVRTLDREAGRVVSGAVDAGTFAEAALALLRDAHARAAVLGSYRATDGRALDLSAAQRAAAQADQTMFLMGFVEDLRAGRYNRKAQGGEGAEARRARFALYALRLTGTANAAWLETLKGREGAGAEVLWVLGARERHCQTCLYESSAGWRAASLLTRVPGDGSTLCLVRCACKIVTRNGSASYEAGAVQ